VRNGKHRGCDHLKHGKRQGQRVVIMKDVLGEFSIDYISVSGLGGVGLVPRESKLALEGGGGVEVKTRQVRGLREGSGCSEVIHYV